MDDIKFKYEDNWGDSLQVFESALNGCLIFEALRRPVLDRMQVRSLVNDLNEWLKEAEKPGWTRATLIRGKRPSVDVNQNYVFMKDGTHWLAISHGTHSAYRWTEQNVMSEIENIEIVKK